MRRFLIATVFALLTCSCAKAQQPPTGDYPMDKVLAARADLIHRYVQSEKFAWGVAVCGETDLLNGGESTYLTVYVYKDSLQAFLTDFSSIAELVGPGDGRLGVGGIPISVDTIDRKETHERPKSPAINGQPADRAKTVPSNLKRS